jgi:hypothetical protein
MVFEVIPTIIIEEARMGAHLHKRLSVQEVKEVFERYVSKAIGVDHVLALLKIQRRRFFDLLKRYREAPDRFSLASPRRGSGNRLDATVKTKLVSELQKEAALIADPRNPVRTYNYSDLQEVLAKKHRVHVSLPTIIARAKKTGGIRKRSGSSRTTGKSSRTMSASGCNTIPPSISGRQRRRPSGI